MHKIGLISDIHGNDVAFKEVLKRLDGKVDEIICLGDMIGIGPNSNDVVDIARGLKNFKSVLGNHERYLLYGFNNPNSCTDKTHQDWQKNQISKENLEYIKTIPVEIVREYKSKKLLFLHYARKDVNDLRFELIIHDATYDELYNMFKKHDADIYFYGHEHIASIVSKDKQFIDVGSLGCPFPSCNIARYGILEIDEDIKYYPYTFTYDTSKILNDMEEKKMPNREFISKAFYQTK